MPGLGDLTLCERLKVDLRWFPSSLSDVGAVVTIDGVGTISQRQHLIPAVGEERRHSYTMVPVEHSIVRAP